MWMRTRGDRGNRPLRRGAGAVTTLAAATPIKTAPPLCSSQPPPSPHAMSEPSTPSLRRSSRLQAKGTPSYADNEEDDTSASAGPSSKACKPPVKRARKSASSGHTEQTQQGSSPKALGPRGRRRTLSKLVDMPLDILFEVSARPPLP